MKKILSHFTVVCAAILLLSSCKKETKDNGSPTAVSQETLTQIQKLGFATEGVQKSNGGYLVEGDILLSEDDLRLQPSSPSMIIAREEQYRTFNLVSVSRHPVIKIALNNSSAQH